MTSWHDDVNRFLNIDGIDDSLDICRRTIDVYVHLMEIKSSCYVISIFSSTTELRVLE